VNACVHTYTEPQTSSTRSRGLGWRIHGSVEDTKLSTNKQHTLSRGCSHCVMLGGRNLRMIPYWSINFLSSSALCTDALSHTSRRRLAGNSSGPVHDVCFLQEQELHRHRALSLNALSRLRQRPVMPAAGCLRVRLAFGHSQTQEPLALVYCQIA